MSTPALFIFEFVIFIFSVIIHEISHGVVAEQLGDPTARLAGRLTFNPLKHIDPFGSIILPLLLAVPMLFGAPSIIFGWAKPVPYNPLNLKNPKLGAGKIAAAGPAVNLLLALIFGIAIRLLVAYAGASWAAVAGLFAIIVYVNVLLAVFNLVPIPPLDGSKVLYALLPASDTSAQLFHFLERYGMILLLAFVFFGFQFILPVVGAIFTVFTGQPLG